MNLTDNSIWLIQIVFTIYLIILWLRILLPSTHTSSANPVSQLVMRLTNFCVKPLAKLLPKAQRFDYVTLLIILIVEMIQLYLIGYLQTNQLLNFFAIFLWAVGQMLDLLLAIFVWSIILEVIFSWVSVMRRQYYAIQDVLQHLTNPVLRPIQALVPHVGPFDLSPLIALLILFAAERYLAGPIVQYGIIWAFDSSIGV